MASFLRKEIQAAVREEVSRVIGISTNPIPPTTGTSTEERTMSAPRCLTLKSKGNRDQHQFVGSVPFYFVVSL